MDWPIGRLKKSGVAKMEHTLVQLVALPISLLMIMLGQASAWFAKNPEPDLTTDIKRKVMITPILVVFNVLFIGVPAVVLAIDKFVFLYNLIALVAIIIVFMTIIKCCKCGQKAIVNVSKCLYLLASVWLTGLIIWATYSAKANHYPEVNIIKSGYFDIVSAVLIACNPIAWLFVLLVISLACLIVFGSIGLVISLLVSIFCCNAEYVLGYLLFFGVGCCGGCCFCFNYIIN